MSWILIVEQSLNGLQFGLMLFLLAAGLTLVFGIMDMINLAHGSLYMLGAFLAATLVQATGSFAAGVLLAIPATAVLGMLLEMSVLRTLYARDHLSQVLATFALILIFNEGVRIIWAPDMPLSVPAALSGPVQLLPGMVYPAYRDRKSTRLNSSHMSISYAVFCLKKKTQRYAAYKNSSILAISLIW